MDNGTELSNCANECSNKLSSSGVQWSKNSFACCWFCKDGRPWRLSNDDNLLLLLLLLFCDDNVMVSARVGKKKRRRKEERKGERRKHKKTKNNNNKKNLSKKKISPCSKELEKNNGQRGARRILDQAICFFSSRRQVFAHQPRDERERKNVETHLGKFPFILAVAMIRIFFFLSLDGTNVTLRVYLTERREVSSRSEKRARATRARCETFFSQIEREKQPKNNQRGGRKPPSSLNSFLEKNVSHGRQRARKKHGPRATSRRVNPDFCERKPWMRFLFELNESPRAMV